MRVSMLVVDGMADSGYSLILDVFDAANLLAPHADVPRPAFDVRTYGFVKTVRTVHGMQISPVRWAGIHDDPPDVLIPPSLGLVTGEAVIDTVRDHPVLPQIVQLHKAGTALAAACSATFFLAEADVLDGLNATTSWWLGPFFRARYPRVRLDESQALAFSGDITTAGAALAHLDLAMSLVGRVSPALAGFVADYLAVGDRPKQSAVTIPSLLSGSDPVLSSFDQYVRDHLASTIRVPDAAQALGVSERTLQRATTDTLGIPPIRYIQQVRLDQAVHLLRTTDRSLDVIANSVGYQDAATLRSLIRRHRGVTTTELRRRGRTSERPPPRAL